MVLIEWQDSAQSASEWQWLDEVVAPSIVTCKSIGFLVADNKTEKSLAISVGTGGGPRTQVSGVISIPTKCVLNIKRLVT